MKQTILFGIIIVLLATTVNAATLTCQQISDPSIEIPQFSSYVIEVSCSASGGSVSNIQITPNPSPGTGLTITSSKVISSTIGDQQSASAKWSVAGDTPNTYSMSYQLVSSGTNSWNGASTTAIEVPAQAQLVLEYVLPPSLYDPSVTVLDFKITNIGGTTANNIKLKLNDYDTVNYPTTINAGASASYAWTNETGYNESGVYTTKVYIGDTLHDSAAASVLTPEDARELYSGFNLISLKKVPSNSAITSVLSSIEGNYTKVWRWNTTEENWDTYIPALGEGFTQTLETMSVGEGYWIKTTSEGVSLDESGSYPTTTNIDLIADFNLIGFPSTTNQSIATALTSIDGNYDKVWRWNTTLTNWDTYIPALGEGFTQTLETMIVGEGYWIKMSAEDTLTITN
jgi:hypothetical protein